MSAHAPTDKSSPDFKVSIILGGRHDASNTQHHYDQRRPPTTAAVGIQVTAQVDGLAKSMQEIKEQLDELRNVRQPTGGVPPCATDLADSR